VHDLREFTHDRHRTVDDRPFGGGEGMVLKPEPLAEAVEHLGLAPKQERKDERTNGNPAFRTRKKIFPGHGPRAAQNSRVVLLCGRYEGVDRTG